MAIPNPKDMELVYDLHKTLVDSQVIVAYEGEFNSKITQTVLTLAESNLDQKNLALQAKRKAFNIALECLQNISSHSDRNEAFPNGIFMIGYDGDEYFVSSGNIIKQEKIEMLRSKLDLINNLDETGLKQLHQQTIKESLAKKETSNAGLGLISIARKSNQKIGYQFTIMDAENAFFTFQATFLNKPEPVEPWKN